MGLRAAGRLSRRSDHEHLGAGPDRSDRARGRGARATSPPRRPFTASGSTSPSITPARGRRRSRRRPRRSSRPTWRRSCSANPSLRDVIVGNEPNLNRFWLPQFNEDGTGASAAAYLALLAATYDAVKAAAPETIVWGGALAPRGVDKPFTGRDTISPTRFIREWGEAYAGERPHDPVHGRLRLPSLRRQLQLGRSTCRRTTPTTSRSSTRTSSCACSARPSTARAQVGSGLPILYDEYGIESIVPPEKAVQYAGTEPATTRPVDEWAQAAAYAQAIKLAYCQSNVAGILLFHALDEAGLSGWQSGLYYPDGTPKSSLGVVRDTMDAIASGALGKCAVAIRPVVAFAPRTRTISLRCDRDCVYRARLVRLPAGSITAWKNGRAGPGSRQSFQLGARVAPGRIQALVTFVHATRPGAGRRARQRRVLGALALAALTLAGCGGSDDEPVPRRRGRRRRSATPGRRSTSSRRPASARSGSRASGSPVSRRRRRRRSPRSGASSSARAKRGSSSASTTPAPRPRR